ncbi:hypothetical protein KI440_03265 [Candidatus Saccharibacteria bacterium TM7i]|nr:hypothetical protein KI440_03265 [Candidatus Saccharibacteria bacterium TM7i]
MEIEIDDDNFSERRTTRVIGSLKETTNDPTESDKLVRFPHSKAPKTESELERSDRRKTIASCSIIAIAMVAFFVFVGVTYDRLTNDTSVLDMLIVTLIIGLAFACLALWPIWALGLHKAGEQLAYWYREVPQGEVYEVGTSTQGDYIILEGYNRAGEITHQRHEVDFTRIQPVARGDYYDFRKEAGY